MVQLSGHLKGEVYLEAALMFMMSCYENEVSEGDAQWAGRCTVGEQGRMVVQTTLRYLS